MIRLFIALKIPDNVRKKIFHLPQSIVNNYNDFKWEKYNKIHLTLKFIGEVKEELVQPIFESVKFIENYPAFGCSLTKFGFFYRFKEAKILWLGLSMDDSIKELVRELNYKLEKFNIPVEKRDFKPHLTMLRIKKKVNEDFINSFVNFEIKPEKFISSEVALMKSELSQSGSVYSDLKIINLNKKREEK